MGVLGPTILLKGELRSTEDITLEGRVEGQVVCANGAVVLTPSSAVTGEVIARDITVHGRVEGQLIATDVVDVRAEASINGQVISKRFILNEAAQFTGRVEPQHLEAALRVAEYRRKKAELQNTAH